MHALAALPSGSRYGRSLLDAGKRWQVPSARPCKRWRVLCSGRNEETDAAESADATIGKPEEGSSVKPAPERPVRLRKKPELPPQWQPPSETTILASLLAYSGVIGSAAVLLGKALHVDPFGGFHYDQADIIKALILASPVYALTLLIMLPDWSNWSLPSLDSMLSSSAPGFKGSKQDAEAAARAVSASAGTEQPPAAPQDAAEAGPSEAHGTGAQATEQTDEPWLLQQQQQQQQAPTAASPASSSSSSSRFPMDGPAVGSSTAGTPWRPQQGAGRSDAERSLATFKDAMHLAQGYYIGNNPSKGLSVALEGFIILLDSLASEMLYRAVAITWASTWIKDRLFEAGLDDDVLADSGSALTVADLSKWAAVLAFGLLAVVLAVRKIVRSRRRASFMLQLSEMEKEETQRSSTEGSSESSERQERKRSLRDAFSTASSAMTLSSYIQGSRDLLQLLALNSAYVVTGNLAASYAASVANQLVISALQRYAQERLRKRSEAIAEHLEELNAQLRSIAAKKSQKQAAAEPAAGLPAAQAAGAVSSVGGSHGRADAGPEAGAAAAAAAAGAAAAGAAAGAAAVEAAAAAAVPAPASATEAVDLPLLEADSLQRTISSLDQLLGELAASPGGPGAK